MMRTAMSAASSSAEPVSALGTEAAPVVADQGPQMRRNESDEADGAGDGDRAADAERHARNDEQPKRPTSTPRLCAVSRRDSARERHGAG